jgi:hypothetical protein
MVHPMKRLGRRPVRATLDRRARILNALRNGYEHQDVARLEGVSRQYVNLVATQAGLAPKSRRPTDSSSREHLENEVLRMSLQGIPLSVMSERLNVPYARVSALRAHLRLIGALADDGGDQPSSQSMQGTARSPASVVASASMKQQQA